MIFFLLFLVLIGFTIYLFLKRKISKGYIALATMSSLFSILSFWISSLTINWYLFLISYFIDGKNIEEAIIIAEPSLQSMIISSIACFIIAFLIYKFGNKTIKNWDGDTTLSVSKLEEMGLQNSFSNLAFSQLSIILQGKIDSIVNNQHNGWKLTDPPSEPSWRNFSKDLLKLEYREVNIDETNWSDLYNCWIGILDNPISPNKSEKLFVFVEESELQEEEILKKINLIHEKMEDTDLKNQFIVCVNSLDIYDNKKEIESFSYRLVSKGSLILKSLDLTSYCKDIIRRFESNKIPGTDFSLKDSFVSPTMYPIYSDSEPDINNTFDVFDTIEEWINTDGNEHLSIVGEYGQGKSSALLAYCTRWARAYLEGEKGNRIPLLIELRGRSPSRQGAPEFLNEWGMRFNLNGQALYNLIRAGNSLLIFEGFDEIQNAGRKWDRLSQFNALWHFAFPTSKVIFTGRPNFFLDEKETLSLLRIDSTSTNSGKASTKRFHLSFLDNDEIKLALRNFEDNVISEIIQACIREDEFQKIASRPSMLPLIGSQWDTWDSQSEEGLLTTGNIIRHFVDFLYSRKEAEIERDVHERGLPIEQNYQLMPRVMRHYFTIGIVGYMVNNDAKNTINKEDFTRTITALYKNFESVFKSEEYSAEYGEFTHRLKLRLEQDEEHDIISTIATEVRSNGLFVRDPSSGPDNLNLSHKQYYEYLIAELMYKILKKPESEYVLAITKATSLPNSIWKSLKNEPQAAFHLADLLNDQELNNLYQLSRSNSILNQFLSFFEIQSNKIVSSLEKIPILKKIFSFSSSFVFHTRIPSISIYIYIILIIYGLFILYIIPQEILWDKINNSIIDLETVTILSLAINIIAYICMIFFTFYSIINLLSITAKRDKAYIWSCMIIHKDKSFKRIKKLFNGAFIEHLKNEIYNGENENLKAISKYTKDMLKRENIK